MTSPNTKHTTTRQEFDSMGYINVPSTKYWGAQTQRSLTNFPGFSDTFPQHFIQCFAMQKKAAAMANNSINKLADDKTKAIVQACDEIMQGNIDTQHFPLCPWQTGSGTQTHMNVNEVISNRAIEIMSGEMGSKQPVHPNDDVNKGQSSNDTFPTVMHIAAATCVVKNLMPALETLAESIQQKVQQFHHIVKIGRTHLQDATPLRLGDEFSGYLQQLHNAKLRVESSMDNIYHLAQGGTAVGSGLNSTPEFVEAFISNIRQITGLPFETSPNKFEALASNDAIVQLSGSLNTLAVSLHKIANDIRFLASGPRCGIGELTLPSNEPGSSIMPGKVNPTQCESLTMIATQVMGNNAAISFAGSNGHFELNVYKPVMICNLLQSIEILACGMNNFAHHCVDGITANEDKISYFLNESLMLVTSLNPLVGYDKAAKIAKEAHEKGTTLREAALANGVSAEDFEKYVNPKKMV